MWLSWKRRGRLYVLISLTLAFITYLSIVALRQNGVKTQHDVRSFAADNGLDTSLARFRGKKHQGQSSNYLDQYLPVNLTAGLESRSETVLLRGQPNIGPDASSVSQSEDEDISEAATTIILKEENQLTNECLQWVNLAPKPPYYLTVVLLVRIYEKDKAKLTTAELKMWLQYLRYAGVEHVYIYDAFVYQNEPQLPHLKEFLKDGYVTYIDWHTHNPYTISGTQVAAYQNCINVYKEECHWQAAIDIDEYPFSPKDQNQGFLFRYMKKYEEANPQVSELSMQNFLFLGKPLKKELMIERLMRRTPQRANTLSKPIYKPANIHLAQVHHNSLKRGHSSNAVVGELRMNHYWGARLQNWGNDTEESLKMTVPDDSMKLIIKAFQQCEALVRRYLT